MSGEIDLFKVNSAETRPHQESLGRVVSETFEKMGFMEAFSCNDRDNDTTSMLCATLLVEEPAPAKLYLSCPQKLGWKLAETMYGLEELSTEVVADMLTELLNTIAGSWLSTIIPNQTFSLSIPECCSETFHIDDSMYEYHFKIDNFGVISIGLKNV